MSTRAILLAVILSACGQAPAPPPLEDESSQAWTLDGFLQFLPEDVSITLRLPERSPGSDALLAALDRKGQLFDGAGLDPARRQGLAVTPRGAWVHYLPAADKAALNAALPEGAGTLAHREERDWVILSQGGTGAGKRQGDPLPPGDMAIRARFHPLVDLFFPAGDRIEAGLTLGSAGTDFSGRVRPGENSPTTTRLVAAHALDGGLIDLMPAHLAVRVETGFPATVHAAPLTRLLGRHCGVKEGPDRIVIERFLREMFTGADPATGLGIGLEFSKSSKEGASVVFCGKVADGPASPVLDGVRKRGRSSFGSLVLDIRREAPEGMIGHFAWVAEAKPNLAGLPESAWTLIGDLCAEDRGMPVAYVETDGWFALAVGRRCDHLVAGVHRRLRGDARSSDGSRALRSARERRPRAEYLLGVVINGAGFSAMAEADRAQLAALLGAGKAPQQPGTVALAAFRGDGELLLEGRALY